MGTCWYLRIELHGEVERLLHRRESILRKVENIIRDNVDVVSANHLHHLTNIDILERTFGYLLPHELVPCLNPPTRAN